MQQWNGTGVYDAIAFGTIKLLKKHDHSVRRTHIEDVKQEKERYERAKKQALVNLDFIYQKALKEVGETNAQIFEIHKMMMEDEDYNQSIYSIIETQKVNADYAVAVTADRFSEMFSSMDDGYMQARAIDIKDISNRILVELTGCKMQEEIKEKSIVCATDLTPSETVSMNKDNIAAFVISHGSSNSHTAILARNMNIPAIIGAGEDFLTAIQDGDEAIVDGYEGILFVSPDSSTIKQYTKKEKEETEKRQLLERLKGKENITIDGTSINVYANIGSVDHIGEVLFHDAGGIGLFRSEFIYLEDFDYPSEEKQFLIYKKVLESLPGKKVIIRTLDIGADKKADYFGLSKEENPALGFRAIRICLSRPEIFKTQLRALFRASAYGSLGIMFPMIVSLKELNLILLICD